MGDMQSVIGLKGVKTHNLKNINIEFPLGKLTTVTGVSGSGKSSLVFDSLYVESYRRYVESLSSFARQYMQSFPKPDIDSVAGLLPAIAVRQSRAGLTNRSTVGTLSELYDVFRIIYAKLSDVHCYKCHIKLHKYSPETVAHDTLNIFGKQDATILIAAPLREYKKIDVQNLKGFLENQGFARIYRQGKILRLDDLSTLDPERDAVILDRITVSEDNFRRMVDSMTLAFKIGHGALFSIDSSFKALHYFNSYQCPQCWEKYQEPTEQLFSYNHPLGACPKCQGFGQESKIDEHKVLTDQNLSLEDEAVECWNFGEHRVYYNFARQSAKKLKINFKKPLKEYSEQEKLWLWKGDGGETDFDGIEGYFRYLDSKRYKPHYRIHSAKFRTYITCTICRGDRLNKKALSCKIDNLNIADIMRFSAEKILKWMQGLSKEVEDKSVTFRGLKEAVLESEARLSYLCRVGLSYLSMDRLAKTLSGGELQRINMARCLGSSLTSTMFCLDEPTVGLHPKDTKNLIAVMKDLRDLGNTVVVIEHDPEVIKQSDYFIKIGPYSGKEGGEVVFKGLAKDFSELEQKSKITSLTGKDYHFLQILNANTHNLKNVSARFPVGKMTVVCGVSGSGKTSLVQHTFFPVLQEYFEKNGGKVSAKNEIPISTQVVGKEFVKNYQGVLLVNQRGLSRSSRSNIATYLEIMGDIRKILAQTPEAKKLKLTPGSFSFNSVGGRCENCKGLGTVVEDLSFLGEMEVICPVCRGQRFEADVLAVKFKGKNLLEILALTVSEAKVFFAESRAILKVLNLCDNLGLGYLSLGQHTSSFSGGEAQRLKLLSIMKDTRDKPSILIFDEPTSGLADSDVDNLIMQFHRLTSLGHMIILVEHNLRVIRAADWVIELGPEAADKGGEVIFEGFPQDMKNSERSVTAKYL